MKRPPLKTLPAELNINTARGMALEILNRVVLTDAYAEPLLDAYLSRGQLPNIHEQKLATHLVYGVLRTRGYLDWIIRTIYRGDFNSLDIPIINIIRTGLYQLLYTNRIPPSAAVNEAVNLAKVCKPAGAALVNAILRNFLRRREGLVYPSLKEDPEEYLVVMHSHPRWLVRRWLEVFGREKTLALCVANNEIPPATLRVNSLKVTREAAALELQQEGLEVGQTTFSAAGLVIARGAASLRATQSFQQGHVLRQDEASQLISQLLEPRPGELNLDLCAGQGLKATHLAEIMGNKGKVFALDNNVGKLAALRGLAARQGIGIIETWEGDATTDLGSAWHNKFDRILVDAPCSGLGTVRRNPEIKWRCQMRHLQAASILQKKILHNAATYLRRGGTMIYSVCTIMPEENEEVLEDFLSRHSDFCLAPVQDGRWPGMDAPGGFMRTGMEGQEMDGFFAAVMIRK